MLMVMATITARDPLNPLPPPSLDMVTTVMVTDTVMLMVMATITVTPTITARDLLSLVMDILIMVMVMLTVDIMDTPTATANRFILMLKITTNGCACLVQVFDSENFDLRSTVPKVESH